MARTVTIGSDWNGVRAGHFDRGSFELWSRFSCEVADDVIVSPFLYGTRRTPQRDRELYTMQPCGLLVMHGRGEDQLRFLTEEVAPRIAHLSFAFILDADERALVPANDLSLRLPATRFPSMLRTIAAGYDTKLDDIVLDIIVRNAEETVQNLARPADVAQFLSHPAIQERVREAIVALEQRPIRLWEAMLWRGENYRWELISGEVPLVGELFGALAANRTLMQCVSDAEHTYRARAEEHAGWVVCGPMRLRQRGTRVEIRFRLDPSDRRVAFQPQSRLDGDDASPSFLGALLAGGGSGKTEMMAGYTDSVIEVDDPPRVAHELAEQIRRSVGVTVIESPPDEEGPARWPSEPSAAWHIRWWERWVYVLMPTMGIPWDVHAGLHLSDDFMFAH